MSSGTSPTWNGDPGQSNGIKDLLAPYVACMKAVYAQKKIPAPINLDEYENVQRNALLIYGMLKNQRMPPGNPWPTAKVILFKDWMDADCPLG